MTPIWGRSMYVGMNLKNDDGQAAAAFYDKRRKWLDFICVMDGLSDRAFRVGYWLAKRMNGQDQSCWYGVKEIAKRLSMSEDKVLRAVAELEEEGVLIVVREHRKSNVYYIRLPYE
ncbi:helix-turn-helix domain-containing protein [Agrobacterium rubi]|uniref:helix-turn-helix domain-containing protein n=1 Tax=Agrobacterium rubi TaxID=28099 RepID=UPI001574CB3D|nr:helix-turn-helix domain-containing protein [Agrobacterium rubi]NTE87239.1 helix-turn-helix domain-containing protein [Agrobacterium rubi]NTF03173.1 helix-turn-helix domain-containing protein [Agrobacterium rubi]